MEIKKIKLSEIIFDESIYPRVDGHNVNHVQSLYDNLDSIDSENELIIVNQHLKILNGRHRHLAYLKKYDGKDIEIKVNVIETRDSLEDEDIAYELDAKAALKYSKEDRVNRCRKLYYRGFSLKEIAKRAYVSLSFATDATKKIREDEAEKQEKLIFDLYLQCYNEKEISNKINIPIQTISRKIMTLSQNNLKIKMGQTYENDSNFKLPIYNIRNYAKCTNDVTHFGKTEQNILDNLLYLYTKPFDIVLDPFAGGGSTIDVCKKRLRRYYVSDRKPIVERENEIRKLDIVDELPKLNKRWAEVTLTYLDPPYWKQAENQYSKDKEDLANQSLEDFTKNICSVVDNIAKKQSKGIIALIIQPTQWKAENKEFTDHVFHIINGIKSKNLLLENRISCPYSTQQCTPQMVNWAKENKKLLVLSRELIIWRII
jgi:hypothetical protein